MKIVWSRLAVGDLAALRTHIGADNRAAARLMALRIVGAVAAILPQNPAAGRPGRVPGTRELVIARTPYIVPYRVRADVIEILRVYHAARRWPDRL